jgi:tetratricopeptide (TPR) repeat protein
MFGAPLTAVAPFRYTPGRSEKMVASRILASLMISAGVNALDEDAGFAAARELYAQRATLDNHVRAADGFAAVAKRLPENLEAQLWCARTAYYAAHRLTDDKAKMRRVADEGKECGERLIAQFPDSYPAQVWGVMARFRKAAATSWIPPLGEIEKLTRQLETLRAKAPDEYMAYLLLGAVYRELPGWPLSIGDSKKSLALLESAQKLAPDNAEVLLELAATQKASGHREMARETYQRCIDQGAGAPELSWETADARAWAKKMIAELK